MNIRTNAKGTRQEYKKVPGTFWPGAFLAVFLISFGGTQLSAASDKPVLTINKLKLAKEELEQELSLRPSWEREVPSSGEPEWVSQLIERELLVQEAQRMGLDRREDFMRTIERFWKEALIKLLLDRKLQEISGETHVYDSEMEARYKALQEESQGTPAEDFNTLKDELKRSLQHEKESAALDDYIESLRTKAKIMVDAEAVAELSRGSK